LAKRRPDGALAVLVNNMRETTAGPFDIFVFGKPRSVTLKGYEYDLTTGMGSVVETVMAEMR